MPESASPNILMTITKKVKFTLIDNNIECRFIIADSARKAHGGMPASASVSHNGEFKRSPKNGRNIPESHGFSEMMQVSPPIVQSKASRLAAQYANWDGCFLMLG